MNPNESNNLESAVTALLRRMPDRRAPAGLEARVLAEISRRAALPWWRKSFAHWPAPARLFFVAGSATVGAAAVAGLVALAGTSGAHQVSGAVSNSFAWLFLARDVLGSFDANVRQLLAAIPPLWLYGSVAAVACGYATLAAIGAATYRAVSFARQTS